MDKHGALRLFALDPPAGAAARRAARHRHAGLGRARRGLGLAQGGDQPWRRAEARLIADRLRTELEQRPPRGRHGRARARDLVAAPARGGAGGAGPADLRRRRPRLLVPGAGPRRPGVAARARQPAGRGGAADGPVLALPRRGHRRAGRCPGRPRSAAASGTRVQAHRRQGRAAARAPSASTPSARRWRCCSSARSWPPATTSPRSPAPAATAGSRTCAS